jgi:hypothetical protein
MQNSDTVRKKLAAIGISFAIETKNTEKNVDIEEALILSAQILGEGGDAQIFTPLLSWIMIHGEYVNVERLAKLKLAFEKDHMPLPWISAFSFFGKFCGQTRWKLLCKPVAANSCLGDLELEKSRVEMRGAAAWSLNSGFLVSKTSAIPDPKYVLHPSQLARSCHQYRNRLLFGANWRADVIWAIENGAKSPIEISRRTGASYETARRIFREWSLVEGAKKKEKIIS